MKKPDYKGTPAAQKGKVQPSPFISPEVPPLNKEVQTPDEAGGSREAQAEVQVKKIRQYLQACLGKEVVLVVTDNRVRMLSTKKMKTGGHLRLHRIFLDASREVLAEIAAWMKDTAHPLPATRLYIKENGFRINNKPPGSYRTKGKYYDLQAMYDSLNREYFAGRIGSVITWGRRSPAKRVRQRILGNYNGTTNTIRINPVLDRSSVPPFIVEYIVYHEMLHADCGIGMNKNRRTIHTREFKEREREFKHYEAAQKYLALNGW